MRREQLEHLIRACAALTDEDDIVVIGSQAIHASHHDTIQKAIAQQLQAICR